MTAPSHFLDIGAPGAGLVLSPAEGRNFNNGPASQFSSILSPSQYLFNNRVFNVRDYGAAGDGVTDDTAAIQAALSAANVSAGTDGTNSVCYVPPGTYQISGQLVVKYGVTLAGAGARSSRIRVASTFAALTTTGAIRMGDGTVAGFGIGVRDLILECSSIVNSIGIWSADLQDNCYIERVLINNYDQRGIEIDGTTGVLTSAQSFVLKQIEAYRAGIAGGATAKGIHLKNGSFGALLEGISVSGKVGNLLGIGIHLENFPATIIDGHVEQATDGIQISNGAAFVSIINAAFNTVTNGLHITNVTQMVAAVNLHRFAGTGVNTVLDDGAGETPATTLTDTLIPWYSREGRTVPNLLRADGFLYATRAIQGGRPAPAWAANVAINAADGNTQYVTASSNIAATVQTPTNPPGAGQSQRLTLIFLNSSGGALTTAIAFSAGYKVSGTVSPGNGQRITVVFNFDATAALWIEAGRSAAL